MRDGSVDADVPHAWITQALKAIAEEPKHASASHPTTFVSSATLRGLCGHDVPGGRAVEMRFGSTFGSTVIAPSPDRVRDTSAPPVV